jgi:hypothetical protein
MSLSKIVKSINMTISGFTMVRNATKYYFPIRESILSILPIVDEYIIALGKGDDIDLTRKEIESIDSPKIKIIDRIWSEQDFIECKIYATETSFALSQCSGDWCIYLQADEVIHEDDLPTIVKNCSDHLHDESIDGFLFDYHHFFGDYDHYLPFHGWYKNEIRIVRNHKNIYSIKDAQSFRKGNNEKLNVLPIEAYIYHYGWVRPPESMQSKNKEQDTMYHGEQKYNKTVKPKSNNFDYGALGRLPRFKKTHPKAMDEFRLKLHWKDQLNYTKKASINRPKMKHEKLKYRLITFFENLLNGGRDFVGYTNWNIVKAKK